MHYATDIDAATLTLGALQNTAGTLAGSVCSTHGKASSGIRATDAAFLSPSHNVNGSFNGHTLTLHGFREHLTKALRMLAQVLQLRMAWFVHRPNEPFL